MKVYWKKLSSGILALLEVGTNKVLGTVIPHCGGLDSAWNYEARLLHEDMTVEVIDTGDYLYKQSNMVWDSHDVPGLSGIDGAGLEPGKTALVAAVAKHFDRSIILSETE